MGERKKSPLAREVVVEQHTKKYKITEKVCPVCKEKFMGTGKAVYNTLACRMKANYARHQERYAREKREKYQAQKTAKK